MGEEEKKGEGGGGVVRLAQEVCRTRNGSVTNTPSIKKKKK